MKTKILKISLVAVIASTSLYAFGGPRGFDSCDTMRSNMSYGPSSHLQNDSLRDMMITLSDMDLSSSQWRDIRKVMFDLREQRFDNSRKKDNTVLINKDGTFDKEEFVKNRTALSKEMIESQSKVVERILNILDESQKKYLVSKLNY